MPRQNRVTPHGEIVATASRGMFMGNRGILHDQQGQLTGRQWELERWIICKLSFKGRKRNVMTPGHYTGLFFLDEATALAAGHRPCWECRREEHERFKRAWLAGNPQYCLPDDARIPLIDARLHQERTAAKTYRDVLTDLPDGTFVVLPDQDDKAFLVWESRLHPWTPAGYEAVLSVDASSDVIVITPRSTVAALRAGYRPEVALHASVAIDNL